jgi:hypothetical protein
MRKVATMTRAPPLTTEVARDAAWQWLTAVWARCGADWLSKETFDYIEQASLHDVLDELVWSQAKILAEVCPSGTPTPDQWKQSWRLSHYVVNQRRMRDRARQVLEAAAADAGALFGDDS